MGLFEQQQCTKQYLFLVFFELFEGFNEMDLEEIKEEIKNYPTPIAGCDVYFNWLLEERDRLLSGKEEAERRDYLAGKF